LSSFAARKRETGNIMRPLNGLRNVVKVLSLTLLLLFSCVGQASAEVVTATRICPTGDSYKNDLEQCLKQMIAVEKRKYSTFLDHRRISNGKYSRDVNQYEGALLHVGKIKTKTIQAQQGMMLVVTATIETSASPVEETARVQRELDITKAALEKVMTGVPTSRQTFKPSTPLGQHGPGATHDGLVYVFLDTYFYQPLSQGNVFVLPVESKKISSGKRKVTFQIFWGLPIPKLSKDSRKYHLQADPKYFAPGSIAYLQQIKTVEMTTVSKRWFSASDKLRYSPMYCIKNLGADYRKGLYEGYNQALKIVHEHPAFVRVSFKGQWAELPLILSDVQVKYSSGVDVNVKTKKLRTKICLATHSGWYQNLFAKLTDELTVSFIIDEKDAELNAVASAKIIVK